MILRYQDVSLHTQVVCYLLPPLLDALKGTVVRDGGSLRGYLKMKQEAYLTERKLGTEKFFTCSTD